MILKNPENQGVIMSQESAIPRGITGGGSDEAGGEREKGPVSVLDVQVGSSGGRRSDGEDDG